MPFKPEITLLELKTPAFAGAFPLFDHIPQAVLPAAVCEGINPGMIFADQSERPRLAFLWTPVGYYFLAGSAIRTTELEALSNVLNDVFVPASLARGETGFILIASPGVEKEQIAALLGRREAIEIYRRPFTFQAGRFAAHRKKPAAIPAGLTLQRMDAALAERCGVLASWASLQDFIAHGIGFALLAGQEVASACWSVFASRQRVEIDVQTDPNYRRRGLAVITASALIEESLRQGRLPNWECFWDNQPSNNLADKLGFVPGPDYPVYYWEEEQSQ